ncbi:hypothetical protein HanXRQr2_Chr13g0587221 [Helianthus annuus]|uniref:Uncharacterized protein n=1 Tax=Helianthus annuus TaxID=4232 RepID=A0A251SRE4_HELAN|nr:hypothetical protein HanXRQr2_Chr13g0587221 [Helianthus annuus]KAJ0849136.1 hypothetical protein HanPSC8_Chr13g0565441 [Helianthus annuus]
MSKFSRKSLGSTTSASVFSKCCSDSDDPLDSSQPSPLASDYDIRSQTTTGSPSKISSCLL